LLLEVLVNGHPIGKIGEFVQRDSELLALPGKLRDLGIRVPDRAPSNQADLVPPLGDRGPGHPTRPRRCTSPPRRSACCPSYCWPLGAHISEANVPVESGIGETLDYDVVGTSVSGPNLGSGLFDLRASSPWGVVSSGFLGYAGTNPNGPLPYSAIRLDSVYTYADFDNLRWYLAGDFINGGLGWTRPVRVGGVQIQSDFSMRPDLVAFPLPSVGGSAAVPSTVDVLVHGTRVLSRQVAPGPFEIPQLPVVTGGGAIQVTVTTEAV
jgi:outer membrane usher protein